MGCEYQHLYPYVGGCGGGILTFYLSEEMKVDGVLRASGQAAAHSGFSGGGSGGSIYITTYHFDGSGQVQVDGNINLYDE